MCPVLRRNKRPQVSLFEINDANEKEAAYPLEWAAACLSRTQLCWKEIYYVGYVGYGGYLLSRELRESKGGEAGFNALLRESNGQQQTGDRWEDKCTSRMIFLAVSKSGL